jgi:hypothetical protein
MPLFYLEELAKPKFTKHCNLKEALHEFIGTAYIVQKIGDTEKYRCKEMHKITDITVKKWSSLFFIRGNAHRK